MSRKAHLINISAAIFLFGLIFFLVPFISSWGLNPKSGEHFTRFNPVGLEDGDYVFLESGREGAYGYKYLVLKHEGEIRVFGIYMRDGKYGMPFNKPWDVHGLCVNLIVVNESILCDDANLSEWKALSWQWNLSGERKNSKLSSLERVPFSYGVNEIVIGRPDLM